MDWLDLPAVQGTLKSLLQHHSSKTSILWCSALFTVQLSHPYMTTGKTIALTRWTFVGKVMSLLLNMLYSLVITFFPRSKCLLISLLLAYLSVQFSSVAQLCPPLCDPMNRSTPGLPVHLYMLTVVQSLSPVRLFPTPWTAAHQASLSFTVSWSLLRFMYTESVMLSNHLILCRSLLLLPSVFPSIFISEVVDISPAILIPACDSSS